MTRKDGKAAARADVALTDLERALGAMQVMPVVTVEEAAQAVPLVDALTRGGLACAEITFRSGAAAAAIALVSDHDPEFLIGAGTVLTREQAAAAIEAGAKFVVSPGLNESVVDYVLSRGIPMLPGIATATELDTARELGLRVVKVFPAQALGGPGYLRALAAPFPMMRFVPTGGVTAANFGEYLALPFVVAVGGSWIAPGEVISAGDFAMIEEVAAQVVARRPAASQAARPRSAQPMGGTRE
jgi:2-dehydro-3-deoxyphosphogluconate aldolase/(4S)-4-hydroxy-2-oxoglutarate aldolase